ncbi:hypothetical protein [Sandaracinus amylolyticus]|uniref:Uncharacterized protein n=1 Tax=Sandaracinus amylolyticus TaxID=927083 RepID=A0A0F6W742_9BACT|nr:hypothetical protein [Sandaracinus amylolyticus]AKF08983.1 hypothetical protein DB32_006132 [Sandaracinus amylolyticus]
MRARSILAALALCVGCSVGPDLLEGLPCPCADGWQCDEAAGICIRGAHDGGVDPPRDGATPEPPAPLATTCWVRPEGCDWSREGFTLVDQFGDDRFTDGEARNATFSPDGCSVYYSLRGDIYRVTRSGPREPYGAPEPIASVNGATAYLDAPSLSPDALELFVASDEGVSGTRSVLRAARGTATSAWGPLEEVTALSPPALVTWEPRLAPHGLRLYYAPDDGVQFIHVGERDALGRDFAPPTRVVIEGLEPGYDTNRPSVTHDERVLVGVQQRHADEPTRIGFYVTRSDWNAAWRRAQPLPSSVSLARVGDLSVSPDGCEVLVRSQLSTATTLSYVDP